VSWQEPHCRHAPDKVIRAELECSHAGARDACVQRRRRCRLLRAPRVRAAATAVCTPRLLARAHTRSRSQRSDRSQRALPGASLAVALPALAPACGAGAAHESGCLALRGGLRLRLRLPHERDHWELGGVVHISYRLQDLQYRGTRWRVTPMSYDPKHKRNAHEDETEKKGTREGVTSVRRDAQGHTPRTWTDIVAEASKNWLQLLARLPRPLSPSSCPAEGRRSLGRCQSSRRTSGRRCACSAAMLLAWLSATLSAK
jgi:hypothetical protein